MDLHVLNTIIYPLFADVGMKMYPYPASKHHMRPKTQHGITMRSVDTNPDWQKQTLVMN